MSERRGSRARAGVRGGRLVQAGARWLLAAVVAASVPVPVDVAGHGGQPLVPAALEIDTSAGSWGLRYSLDVALLLGGGVAIDREWLAARSDEDLAAIAGDARQFFADGYLLMAGGALVPQELAFPGLHQLKDPTYDNGEPPGHIVVEASGPLPAAGGAIEFVLGEGVIPAVVSTTIDGKLQRRVAVLLAGESKRLADVPGGDGDGVGVAAGGWSEGPLPRVEDTGAEAGPDGMVGGLFPEYGVGVGGEGELAGGALGEAGWSDVGFGWSHVLDRGYLHWLFAGLLFLGARGVASLWLGWAASAAAAVLVVALARPAFGVPGELVFAVAVVVMAVLATLPTRRVQVARVAVAAVAGAGHGMATSELFGGAAGSGFAVAMEAGVAAGHAALAFAAFAALGWGWGREKFERRVVRPLAGAAGVAAVAVLVSGA